MIDQKNSEIVTFRNAQIRQFEAEVLQEIEKLSKKAFTKVDKVEWNTKMGFSADNNRITGIGLYDCGLSTPPESIGQLSSLQELYLYGNKLSTLPESISELKSLQTLNLGFNQFTTPPESIGQLSSLQELYLYGNKLSTLPESIGDLKSLINLYLAVNQFTTLPESIGRLSSLKELRLDSNQLSTLPESIGNLTSLQRLNLHNNQISTLPESIGNLKSLTYLKLENNQISTLPESILNRKSLRLINNDDTIKTNPFSQNLIDKCKGLALKASGIDKTALLDFIKNVEDNLRKEKNAEKEKERGEGEKEKKRLSSAFLRKTKPYAYAGGVALVGIASFLLFGSLLLILDPVVVWLFFTVALSINFIIGLTIISTLSGYLKKYLETGVKMARKTGSEKMISFGTRTRDRIFGTFDVVVVIYLIWAIRAFVKTLLAVELIFTVDFAFEYIIPDWVIDSLILIGYNNQLTFLENIDLFFGHFILKLIGISLVFWALYKNGIKYIKKTAFEEELNLNLRYFLLIGFLGAFLFTIVDYSSLKPLVSLGYSAGAILGCVFFLWESNKDNLKAFYAYIILIGSGLAIVWIISLWSFVLSIFIGLVFVFLFFYLRHLEYNRRSYPSYFFSLRKKERAFIKDVQKILKKQIPLQESESDDLGIKIAEEVIIGVNLSSSNLTTLPESIGNLTSLRSLSLGGNQITTLSESISNLKSLQILNLGFNKLTTLPESIGQLSSLQILYLSYNQLSTLPESIGNLTSLRSLSLGGNQITTLPESIGRLSSLQKLDLYDNKLSTLPESITQLTSLEELNLGYNQFTTLPESLNNLNSLKKLYVKDNPLNSKSKALVEKVRKKGVEIED